MIGLDGIGLVRLNGLGLFCPGQIPDNWKFSKEGLI